MTDAQAKEITDKIMHMFARWYNLSMTDGEIIQFRCAIRAMIEDSLREKND